MSNNLNIVVRGGGINDGKFPTRVGGRNTKVYIQWQEMLRRCEGKYKEKRPTYAGATCSDNFKSYTFFYEWCQTQIGFGNVDNNGRFWHLDKDILVQGNKLYSEDTCVFVPQRINSLIVKSKINISPFYLGVTKQKETGKFLARCKIGGGKRKFLGSFPTPEQAFLAYKTFKEAYIKQVAEEYKNLLDPRAYEALMNYEVNIND